MSQLDRQRLSLGLSSLCLPPPRSPLAGFLPHQVVGSKVVHLFDETYSERLYPHDGMMSNTSQVDVEAPDLDKFPRFAGVPSWSCSLQPGDM